MPLEVFLLELSFRSSLYSNVIYALDNWKTQTGDLQMNVNWS